MTAQRDAGIARCPWTDGGLQPLEITVGCTACDRLASHAIRTASYAPPVLRAKLGDRCPPDWDGFFTPHILTCPGCGEADAYVLTARSVDILAATARTPGGAQVQLGAPGLWDGSTPRRPTEAIAHLRALAELSEADGAAWRRLGNACERSELLDEACQSWARALRVDDTEFEAAFSLAEACWMEGDEWSTLRGVQVALCRLGRQPPEGRRPDIVRWLLERLEELGSPSGTLTLMLTWSGDPPGTAPEVVVNVSSIPVRRIVRWDLLEHMLLSLPVILAGFTEEHDSGEPTRLLALLAPREPGPRPLRSLRSHPGGGTGESPDTLPGDVASWADDQAGPSMNRAARRRAAREHKRARKRGQRSRR